MAKLGINTGSNADDGTGDSLRVGAGKINSNFNEVYSLLTGAGNNGSTLLSGIVTSITAGTNISLTGGPTGAIQIASSAVAGSGKFVTNSTGIHTLGSVGIGTTTAENNGLSVLGNVKVGKGVTTLNLNVSGVTTFSGGDINIKGDGTVDTTGVFWDASVATLEFDDLARISFGEGSDLTLYHDENDSWIKDQATGNLLIDSNGAAVKITKAGAAETMAEFNTDGPVKLFHNNVRVLETVSTGATIVGDLYVGGDLFVLDDVTYNEMNSVNLNISGVSTFSGDVRVGVSTLFVDVSRGQIGLGTDVLTGSHLLDVDGDARFSGIATVGTGVSLAANIPVTFTGGSGKTLKIYRDSSNSYITHESGDFYIQGSYTRLRNADGSKRFADFAENIGKIYYNDSLKFATDNHGVIITGVTTATGFSGPLTGTATGLSGSPSIEVTNIVGAAASIAGIVTATSFVKSGGTSSQYLMANGTVTTGISDLGINATQRLLIQVSNGDTDILAAGTSGQLLQSAGSGSAPVWADGYPTLAKATAIARVIGPGWNITGAPMIQTNANNTVW